MGGIRRWLRRGEVIAWQGNIISVWWQWEIAATSVGFCKIPEEWICRSGTKHEIAIHPNFVVNLISNKDQPRNMFDSCLKTPLFLHASFRIIIICDKEIEERMLAFHTKNKEFVLLTINSWNFEICSKPCLICWNLPRTLHDFCTIFQCLIHRDWPRDF